MMHEISPIPRIMEWEIKCEQSRHSPSSPSLGVFALKNSRHDARPHNATLFVRRVQPPGAVECKSVPETAGQLL